MLVIAKQEITITFIKDIVSVTRYYILQSSEPSAPTTNPPPSGWSDCEPSYTSGSNDTLYFVDLTVFTDETWTYSNVSKSGSYEAAKDVISRGENTITNGMAILGNNTNFSSFIYDVDEYRSFKRVGSTGWNPICIDEFIPVDTNQYYTFSYMIKNNKSTAKNYDMLLMYDIDKMLIGANHVMWIIGSTTTLAQDINDGDTIIYLQDVSGFNNATTYDYQRGFIFWNYQNSFGYQYETETYSRNVWSNLWNDGTAINTEANTITLKSPWVNGTIPAGTSVSQCNAGSTYVYLNSNFVVSETNTWEKKSGSINKSGYNNKNYEFRKGTAFVKPGWLINYNGAASCTTWLTNIVLTQNADVMDLENVRNEAASTSKEIQDRVSVIEKNANSINLSVSSLETRVTNNQLTIDEKISSLEEKVALSITEDQVNIQIDKKLQNGVNKVETSTGFRFDEDGLNISKSNSKTNTQINDEGMNVRNTETNDVMLTADKNGVEARNLSAATYLIVGKYSRLEDYSLNGTTKDRTACFWIGE